VVGFADLLLVLTAWGEAPECVRADLNGDGMVGLIDLLIVRSTYDA
jgi:hypothetical protein